MGVLASGTRFGNWLAERRQKKKIQVCQEVIDKLNEVNEMVLKIEKWWLETAAIEFEKASEFGGQYASTHLQRKELCDERANHLAKKRQPVVEELVLFERLIKTEIKALEDGDFTTKKTRLFCFSF